jgi:5'-3' exonuclease
MAKYALIDTANMYWRMRHVANKSGDSWEKIGYSIHLTLASANQVVRKFGIDHVVFCTEGRSWRKDVYIPYKANRVVDTALLTDKEIKESEMFNEAYGTLVEFLTAKTNASVIRAPKGEADDIIARFIHLHPNDEHVIVSSDSDYFQLISENVSQYNGISDEYIKLDGYFDAKGKQIIDKKTKEPKTLGDPQFVLFEKIIRGDTSDNIFSAYPGVRTKGTKNKVGLIEAYADKDRKGFQWNNLMLQKWVDHNNVQHRVMDDYERNRHLIDLTAQPDDIKAHVDGCIVEQLKTDLVPQMGIHFLRFCSKYELKKISDQATEYVSWLSAPYKGKLTEVTE